MDLQITALDTDGPVTGAVRMLIGSGQVGLYMASTGAVVPTAAPYYGYQTKLTSLKVASSAALEPAEILIPQPLPGESAWDVAFTGAASGTVAYVTFGGGWNALSVDTFASGGLSPGYGYGIEETNYPSFLLNTAATPPTQTFVAAILSGYQLGVIGLQAQDGQEVPHVLPLVGSSSQPIAIGRVFGDLSTGLPGTLKLVYLQNKTTGPLAPSGAFCGYLSFAGYEVQGGTLGTPVPLLPGIEICEFDLAVIGTDYLGLLAVTGAGAPLLALFDQTGKALGSANLPAGSWSNAGHWVSSPSIVATPADGNSSGPGFSFAFVEMVDQVATTLHTGTLSSPPPAP